MPTPALVALDRRTGRQLRDATPAEVDAWIAQPIAGTRARAAARHPAFRFTFHNAIFVGDVVIDQPSTPGPGWHGGAGF